MLDYKEECVCSFSGTLAGPLGVIGPVPEGIKVNAYVTGGEVTGPKVTGKLRAVGGDWLTIRKDGVSIVDARITLEKGYERFLRGKCRRCWTSGRRLASPAIPATFG